MSAIRVSQTELIAARGVTPPVHSLHEHASVPLLHCSPPMSRADQPQMNTDQHGLGREEKSIAGPAISDLCSSVFIRGEYERVIRVAFAGLLQRDSLL